MAIVSVHTPNARQADVSKKDPAWIDNALDRVLKGVQIAAGVYGVYDKYQEREIQRDTLEATQARTQQEYEANFSQEFRKDQRTQRIVNSYDAARAADAILQDPNTTPAGVQTALVKAFRASGETGQLTQDAIATLNPNPGIRDTVMRVFNQLVQGKPLEKDKRALRMFVETLRKHQAERMKVHAYSFAAGEGRRIGIPDYVVNEVLRPRSMLTGEAIAGKLTNRSTGIRDGGMTNTEGAELPGEQRSRYLLDVPSAGSPQTEDAIKEFEAGRMPGVTPAAVQEAMKASGGSLSYGQAIIVVQEAQKAIQMRKKQQEFMNRNQPAAAPAATPAPTQTRPSLQPGSQMPTQ